MKFVLVALLVVLAVSSFMEDVQGHRLARRQAEDPKTPAEPSDNEAIRQAISALGGVAAKGQGGN